MRVGEGVSCYNVFMLVFDTICALATSPYKSALALVRLSGPKAFSVFSSLTKREVEKMETGRVYLTKLYENKEDPDTLIDEALVFLSKGPKSYTGFDTVDFSIHGSPLVAKSLLQALVKNGARLAEKGEFSAQAYYNGKMDLLRAQGINDLINAQSQRAMELSNKTLSGENSHKVEELKEGLLEQIAQLEYYVEDQYSDEKDDYDEELLLISSWLKKEIQEWEKVLEGTRRNNKEYQGIKVAIVGEPNVGKSTLLNALIGEDKAIVSSIPGTTRDVVEGEKEIRGIRFLFKDTAGIRRTEDEIENIGIHKSFQTIKDSDLVLLASDSGFSFLPKEKELLSVLKGKKVLKVATKKDLGVPTDGADLVLSSLEGDLSLLIDRMFSLLDLEEKEESAFLGEREESYLEKILNGLAESVSSIEETSQLDIASDTLRQVVSTINELLGKDEGKTMEDIYQTLFSHFCLGK